MIIKFAPRRGFVTLVVAIYIGITLIIATGFLTFVVNSRRSSVQASRGIDARYVAEAGLEKAIWMLNSDPGYTGETQTPFGSGQFTISVTGVDANNKKVVSTGYVPSAADPKAVIRVARATVEIDTTVISFNYGAQAGAGGFEMDNNATVNGNVYSNGPIKGSSGTLVTGTAISAGSSGIIENGTVGGDAKANELRNCTVQGNGYYNVLTSCSVTGSENSPITVPEAQPLPITDQDVSEWKAEAEAGGVNNGSMSINQNRALGPLKINGSLVFGNNVIITITGAVWVTGAVNFGNNVTLRLDPSYGANSEIFLADGRIDIANNTNLQGAGSGSYLVMASEDPSGSISSPAIAVRNNANTALFYARNGTIYLANNTNVVGVAANKIYMDNNSTLTYDQGLANASFTSGPGGSWTFKRGTYISE